MKTIVLIAACVAMLVCFAGCPSGGGSSDNAKPTSGAGSSASSPDSTSAPSDTTISEGIFEIAGVKLGMAYDAWQDMYPEAAGVTMDYQWVTEGQTGIASAAPDDMELAPYDSAWFWESQLVGFYSDLMLSRDEFDARIEALEAKSGPPTSEPPAWVLDAPFFAGYQEPSEGIVQHFWLNEDGREVLMAFHMDAVGQGMFSLINIDLLDGRIEEALMAKMNLGMGGDIDDTASTEELTEVAAGASPAFEFEQVPAGKFGFDGVHLGADANLVKSRFELRKLTAMGMWVDKDWTGRIDGNPMGGAQYPSETAWFLDGGLVIFMSTTEGSEAAYAKTTGQVAEMFGDPLSVIPDWAEDSEFYTSLNFQGNEEGVAIWADEASRGMLFVTFEPSDQLIMAMLVDLDNYLEAMETTNEAVASQGHP